MIGQNNEAVHSQNELFRSHCQSLIARLFLLVRVVNRFEANRFYQVRPPTPECEIDMSSFSVLLKFGQILTHTRPQPG